MSKSYYCEKCNKTHGEIEFYGTNNLEKYPNGKLNMCKKCATMHIDNFDPETYLWLIEECDVPYVPKEWNALLETYAKDYSKLTSLSIFGRYLSKMKLKQYKDYRWKDTAFLRELNDSKMKQTMKEQGYDAQEITIAIEKSHESLEKPAAFLAYEQQQTEENDPIDDYFARQTQNIENDLISDLTDDDKKYLCLKWGKTYRPEEWVKLEQLYQEMMNSYDIQAAGDINTLLLACKCSLKANQLLDIGDVDGAQKATKMYDSLMKSGKWTAAQNKAESDDVVDSIAEIAAICEADGFIPRYYTAGPQDHVDRVIEDLKRYTHDLIENESSISMMIETAVKQLQVEQERIAEAAAMSEEDEEARLFDYDHSGVLDNEDFSDFKDFEEGLDNEDEEYLKQLIEQWGQD